MTRLARMLALALAPLTAPALTPTAAHAQTAWLDAPTLSEMAAVFPRAAKAAGIGGGAELVCTAAGDGRMTDCDILGETPRGQGFGPAARSLVNRRLKAAGVTRGQEVRVPISFPAELASGGAVTVRTPRWTATPTAAEMQALVPKQEGGPNEVRVVLVCAAASGGALDACRVDREEPAGQGFGAAVLALAPKFRADLLSVEGVPTVGAQVRLPVRFSLKPVTPSAAAPPP